MTHLGHADGEEGDLSRYKGPLQGEQPGSKGEPPHTRGYIVSHEAISCGLLDQPPYDTHRTG